MSCGNRFQCGISRFQKHSFTPDKPSNQSLHNENQQKLSDLLKAREEMEKGITENVTTATNATNATNATAFSQLSDITPLENNTSYTPWMIPSTSNYKSITK